MKRLSLIFMFLFVASYVTAATIVMPSMEWLCVKADRIQRGFITAYEEGIDAEGTSLFFCTFQFNEMMKGPQERNFTFACYGLPADSLAKYSGNRVEVLVFFENLSQPIKFREKDVPVKAMQAFGAPAVINLAHPQKILFSAFDFTVMSQKNLILDMCRMIIMQANLNLPAGQAPKKLYQPVPAESEIFRLSGAKKNCYLEVPSFLFPDAQKKAR